MIDRIAYRYHLAIECTAGNDWPTQALLVLTDAFGGLKPLNHLSHVIVGTGWPRRREGVQPTVAPFVLLAATTRAKLVSSNFGSHVSLAAIDLEF